MRTLQLARVSDPALTAEVERYVDLYYPSYKDGHLLTRGGIADQPARYLELIRLIRGMEDDVEAKWDELRPKPTGEAT
jgi:hypothetical protein